MVFKDLAVQKFYSLDVLDVWDMMPNVESGVCIELMHSLYEGEFMVEALYFFEVVASLYPPFWLQYNKFCKDQLSRFKLQQLGDISTYNHLK